MVDHHVPWKNGYPYGDLLEENMENMVIYWKHMGYFGVSIPFDNPTGLQALAAPASFTCWTKLQRNTRGARCFAVFQGVAVLAMGKMRVKPYGNLLFREGDGTPCRTYLTQFWHMFDVFQRWFLGWIDRPTIHQLIYIITQSSKYAQSQTLRYSSRCSFGNSVQYPSSSSLFSKCKSLCPSYKFVYPIL